MSKRAPKPEVKAQPDIYRAVHNGEVLVEIEVLPGEPHDVAWETIKNAFEADLKVML